ncbi:Rv3654c family TadE-like protein [Streptomyces sp. NPDC016675]|uniref:Rv3654c family TadE-like protein n=1 Tax=Streptomyces sp. NPDC016675 TaxID=3364970 RepID=UPI0036F6F13D
MTSRRPCSDRAPDAGLRLGSARGPGGSWAGATGTDRGSATVWSVGAIAVLCLVFGIVLALGQAVVARHRAAGGADMAALAAADHWAQGGAAACARAERVARAQATRLMRCVLTGQVSDVTAASGRGPFRVEVRARAGPASEAAAPAPRAPATDDAAAVDPPTDDPASGDSPTDDSPTGVIPAGRPEE